MRMEQTANVWTRDYLTNAQDEIDLAASVLVPGM